jgi:hypothetical protein
MGPRRTNSIEDSQRRHVPWYPCSTGFRWSRSTHPAVLDATRRVDPVTGGERVRFQMGPSPHFVEIPLRRAWSDPILKGRTY